MSRTRPTRGRLGQSCMTTPNHHHAGSKVRTALFVLVCAALVISAIRPEDFGTWVLETAPVTFGLLVLFLIRKRFRFTMLACTLLAIHAFILVVGGHYTYSKVPLGDWVRDALGLERNHYDRLGHFAQGFIPAIVTREVLLRTGVVRRGGWLFFLTTCVCLAISAFYELLEWCSALVFGDGATAFLGTQGDDWDAQWDMLYALTGAILSLSALSAWHDTQLNKLPPLPAAGVTPSPQSGRPTPEVDPASAARSERSA